MKKENFNKMLILMAFLVTSIGLLGQSTVTGVVLDYDGNPIIGASVVIEGTVQGSATDADGNYTINDVDDGDYVLVAQSIGYAMASQSISVQGNTQLNFALQEDVFGLDDLVVTATFSTRTQKESPLSLTTMKAEEINKLSANSQADILRSIPGITTEGGGGEAGSNIFVRGMPSGGQYVFNPLQFDGMPVLSTFGLNSSAHDVYVRTDLGIRNLEFARGGAASLFGASSVSGIINYSSKTGDINPGNILQLELATDNRIKGDFYTGGQLGGEESNTYYALSGFYRYDEGPIVTGLASEGFQLRGNIKKVFDKGSFTLYGQYIDDGAQFYLPMYLAADGDFLTGDNGDDIETFQTAEAANLSHKVPGGIWKTPMADGVTAKGGYFMADFKYNITDDLKVNAKMRYADYDHVFPLPLNLEFADISTWALAQLKTIDPTLSIKNLSKTYTGTNTTVPGNRMFRGLDPERVRPMEDLSGEFNITKTVEGANATHNITFGSFMSRTKVLHFNPEIGFVTEFNDQPRLIDIEVEASNNVNYTIVKNGIWNAGQGYTNSTRYGNRIAGYLIDEIKLDKWRFDIGFRVEKVVAEKITEGKASYEINSDATFTPLLRNVFWGNGTYTRIVQDDMDWAGVLAALYKVNDDLSVYANLSKGYYFPQIRHLNTTLEFESEELYTAEIGAKYGSKVFSGTAAIFYNELNDRKNPREITTATGTQAITTIENTRSFGLELSWDWRFAEYFSLNGNLTIQEHEYTDTRISVSKVLTDISGNWLERQPKLLYTLGIDYNNKKLDAGLELNYLGEKYPNPTNTEKLDDIYLLGGNIGYTFNVDDNNSIRLGISAFNLLDDRSTTEGNPRSLTSASGVGFSFGRPILPRRITFQATFNF